MSLMYTLLFITDFDVFFMHGMEIKIDTWYLIKNFQNMNK